jgi:hypothetical protein
VAAFANLSFETAGSGAGAASAWTSSITTYWRTSTFGAANSAIEDFESEWDNDGYALEFDPSNLDPAMFDTAYLAQNVEDFEGYWTDVLDLDPHA